MFRLHKTRPAKSGEKINFKFSHFKALQVPKGWDKLYVSMASVETGKSIAKSSKVVVRNGTCQWTESLQESIWVSQNESSKDLEDCLFKLVVAMGSARSGILGEATVNMTDYVSSSSTVPVSLPLNKCNHGTILQVKIHCLTPITKLRDDETKEANSLKEDLNADSQDMDIKSEGTDSIFARSTGSSSSKDLGPILHQGEPGSRETSFSASPSYHSYDSPEDSMGREDISPRNKLGGDLHNQIGRQDSTSSQNIVPQGSYQADDPSQSNHSSFNSRIMGSGNNHQEFGTSSLRISGSSKDLEAAEDTIEELRAEAKMWERNARKLMLDLDILRKEFSDQSKNQANLDMELSTANAERDWLKKEVEQLKLLLEKSMVKQTASEDSLFHDVGATHIQKELEDEIKFQKESNANLAMQLERSQEANIELVSILQELEETIEKQKDEIENLSALQSKFSDMENPIQVSKEENKNLKLQLQQLRESEMNLQDKLQQLEQALEDKNHILEDGGSLNKQTLLDIETEYKSKLSAKEKEIVSLKAKLSEYLKERHSTEAALNGGDANLIREIEALKEKLQELERDCNELTDENLELLHKLKETKKNSTREDVSLDSPSSEFLVKSLTSSRSEVSDDESQMHNLEEKQKKKVHREIQIDYDLSIQELEGLKLELEAKVTELGKELTKKRADIEIFEATFLSKEEEIGDLQRYQNELEAKVSELQKEKLQLEENLEIVLRESGIATRCMNDLQNDLMVLSGSVNSHVSVNRTLERKSSELESGKRELELHLADLEQENGQLSECISDLESRLRCATDEKESSRLELKNSRTLATILQDELTRLRNEMETQKVDLEQELQDMHDQLSEAQEECEYLRTENPKLQAAAQSFVEECNSLQKSNGELRKQILESQEYCANLEAKLRESDKSFSDCSKSVQHLEENISSMLEEFASKERSFASEIDALLDENRKHNEKLFVAQNLFNQMHLEKTTEVENLQQDVENLTKQLSVAHDERERIASDAFREVSGLCEDKAKLESALQEVQSKVKWTEIELNNLQIEAKKKAEGLMGELAASKQNQEMLMADHEKVLKLLENYRSHEEKFKTTMNGLELKLTLSEYERQQLMEESTKLKVQLLNIEHLQDELLTFKSELKATRSEKEKLEASLHVISRECEDLKAEKKLFKEKISTLQKAVSELEDCRHNRVALEEKLRKMEGDLLAKEPLCAQDAELRNELGQIKKANRQIQQRIQLLEEEKNESLTRAQALEEELELIKEEKQNQRESNGYRNQQQREDDNRYAIHDESPHAVGVEPVSKIQLLENKLSKAMEANNKYKVQLNRFLSEGRNSHRNAPRKSKAEGEFVAKEKYEHAKSALQAELKDIRERYFNMSLKYAEVEAQREELVMKLKGAKNGKRWFS